MFNIVLFLLIAGGTLALLAAPVALLVHKGNSTHRVAGNIFFWGMTLVFVTAIYASISHNIPFLFMVSIFSYQMVVKGKRSLKYKTTDDTFQVAGLDWFIVIISFIADLALISNGSYRIIIADDSFGIAALVFGIFGLNLVRRNYTC